MQIKKLVTLLFFVPLSLWAQTTDTTRHPLSVDELLQRGIEQSLRLKISTTNTQVTAEKERAAKAEYLPNLGLSALAGYLGTPTVFQDGLGNAVHPNSPHNMQAYSVEATQLLYKGSKLKYGVEKAGLESEIAKLNVERDKADVKLLLLSKYLELFRLYKQKEVFEHQISDAQRRLQDIKNMKREGMITSNDVIRSELQLTNYQLLLQETNDNIIIVSQQLNIALALPEEWLLEPDSLMLSRRFEQKSYSDYVDEAYESYPELQISRSNVALSEKNVQLAKTDYYPSLSLRGANSLQRPITSSSPPLDMFLNSWNISLVLSFNLSTFYKSNHTINVARSIVEVQKTEQDIQQQNIRTNVKAAYVKHKEAIDRIGVLQASVGQAKENYRIVYNKYLNQLAVLTDLLDAGSVRLETELQLVAAQTNALLSYYQLQRAVGSL